jgi:hypothetical protein
MITHFSFDHSAVNFTKDAADWQLDGQLSPDAEPKLGCLCPSISTKDHCPQ